MHPTRVVTGARSVGPLDSLCAAPGAAGASWEESIKPGPIRSSPGYPPPKPADADPSERLPYPPPCAIAQCSGLGVRALAGLGRVRGHHPNPLPKSVKSAGPLASHYASRPRNLDR
jgi:hypothetical protein